VAYQCNIIQQLVKLGVVGPNVIVTQLVEHCANDGFIGKILVLAPKLNQPDLDLATAVVIEPLNGHHQLALMNHRNITIEKIWECIYFGQHWQCKKHVERL